MNAFICINGLQGKKNASRKRLKLKNTDTQGLLKGNGRTINFEDTV